MTESYNKWYNWWYEYVNQLAEEDYGRLGKLITSGEDYSEFKPEGDWRE